MPAMPSRSRSPRPPRDRTAPTPRRRTPGGGTSNAARLDQLNAARSGVAVPVRPDPTPWGPQNRSVGFSGVQGGDLFVDGPSHTDVVQGQNGSRYLGDCWLLGSLAALAKNQPEVLENAITDNKDGTHTVRLFHRTPRGTYEPESIRVQGTVPTTADGRDAYAQRTDPTELWVPLIEKAFAARAGNYGSLHAGVPGDALSALTGRPSTTTFSRDHSATGLGEELRAGQAEGRAMVAASRADLSLARGGVVPGHAHTVLDVKDVDGQTRVVLRDTFAQYEPEGNGAKDGVFELSLEEFRSQFQYLNASSPRQQPASGPGTRD